MSETCELCGEDSAVPEACDNDGRDGYRCESCDGWYLADEHPSLSIMRARVDLLQASLSQTENRAYKAEAQVKVLELAVKKEQPVAPPPAPVDNPDLLP